MEDAHAKEVSEVRHCAFAIAAHRCKGNLKLCQRCPPQVLAHFSVDAAVGLSAEQVLRARAVHGANELAPDEGTARCWSGSPLHACRALRGHGTSMCICWTGTPFWKLVLKQFDDLLVKILIVAAVVDFLIALSSGEEGLRCWGSFLHACVPCTFSDAITLFAFACAAPSWSHWSLLLSWWQMVSA